MVPLVTVGSAFQAKVLAARLGSEGIVTELRGGVDGPYPFGDVHVQVDAEDLDLARQLLLADEVEEVFDAPSRTAPGRVAAASPWLVVATVVLVAVVGSLGRIVSL